MEAVQERGRQKILIEKDLFGTVRDKVKIAQERLKAFEPSEGYYVADSGGKDSACVLALCKMAGDAQQYLWILVGGNWFLTISSRIVICGRTSSVSG